MNYAELPDEYGLSQDSLRGSAELIQHDLVGAEGRMDPFTRREVSRGELSRNELLALHSAGRYVDEKGEPLRDPSQLLVTPAVGTLTVAPITGGVQTLPVDAPLAPTRYTPEEFVAMMKDSGLTVSAGPDRLGDGGGYDVPDRLGDGGGYVKPVDTTPRAPVGTTTADDTPAEVHRTASQSVVPSPVDTPRYVPPTAPSPTPDASEE